MALAACFPTGRTHRPLQEGRLCKASGRIRYLYRAGLIALGLLWAAPLWALSCAPWTHLHAWATAQGSDRLYLILRGELVFDERALPQTDWDIQSSTPPLSTIEAFFTGEQLGRNGFLRPLQGDVTMEVSCYGPWCAGAVSGVTYVAFAELREGQMVVETNPCGGFLFPATAEIEADLTRCMRGEKCELPALE